MGEVVGRWQVAGREGEGELASSGTTLASAERRSPPTVDTNNWPVNIHRHIYALDRSSADAQPRTGTLPTMSAPGLRELPSSTSAFHFSRTRIVTVGSIPLVGSNRR
jgi:hypothetical protein